MIATTTVRTRLSPANLLFFFCPTFDKARVKRSTFTAYGTSLMRRQQRPFDIIGKTATAALLRHGGKNIAVTEPDYFKPGNQRSFQTSNKHVWKTLETTGRTKFCNQHVPVRSPACPFRRRRHFHRRSEPQRSVTPVSRQGPENTAPRVQPPFFQHGRRQPRAPLNGHVPNSFGL